MQKFVPVLKVILIGTIGFLAIIVVVNLAFGKTSAAAQILLPLSSGVFAFWFLGRANFASVNCPTCTAPQPIWRKPTSFRQLMWGGWSCTTCGTEIDRHGESCSA